MTYLFPLKLSFVFAAKAAPALLALLACGTAAAQATGPNPVPPAGVSVGSPQSEAGRNGWEVILGAGAFYQPEYEGSDELEAFPFPFVSLTYGRLQIGPDRIGYQVYNDEQLSFDVALGYGGERKPVDIDSGYLDGFENIDGAAFLGATGAYTAGDTKVYLAVERYLDGSEGTSATLGVDFERQATARLSFSAGASVTVSDDNYMESYFGVTPQQAAASARGYQPYSAGAGLRRIDLSLGAAYAFAPDWQLRGELGVASLLDDAKDSPVVYDEVQPSLAVFVAYRF